MLTIYADGAEAAAAAFLNRNVYLDVAALDAARVAVDMTGVHAAYEDAIEAADALTSDLDKQQAIDAANIALHEAQLNASLTLEGMVIVPNVKNAILLITGHLYRNRDSTPMKAGDPIDIPPAAEWLMRPYRKIGPL